MVHRSPVVTNTSKESAAKLGSEVIENTCPSAHTTSDGDGCVHSQGSYPFRMFRLYDSFYAHSLDRRVTVLTEWLQ